MTEFYPLSSDHTDISKKSGRRILGLPERQVYRIGVFIFYVVLFVAISFLTKKVKLPSDPIMEQVSAASAK
jgi:hypothetical protein